MRLADIPFLAQFNTKTYWRSPVNCFIAPNAPQYPHHITRTFGRGITRRYFKPNTLSLVACLAEIPDIVVAYGQFSRVGTDAGARQFVAEREQQRGFWGRIWFWVLSWVFWAYVKLEDLLDPDHATNVPNLLQFEDWIRQDSETHWSPTRHPERANRWVAQSLIVDPPYQGKGLGKLLMRPVLERAQEEGICVGLTASTHGEFLYRKLGFTYLGDFSNRVEDEKGRDAGGGIMIWFPEGWKGKTVEEKKMQ
jgi:GNAT superfamily N-acetyltransferase